MTEAERRELYALQDQRSTLLRQQRERKAARWGLGRGAINASCGRDLAALFAEDQERAEAARLAEIEKRIATLEVAREDPLVRELKRRMASGDTA